MVAKLQLVSQWLKYFLIRSENKLKVGANAVANRLKILIGKIPLNWLALIMDGTTSVDRSTIDQNLFDSATFFFVLRKFIFNFIDAEHLKETTYKCVFILLSYEGYFYE